jgi:hypothetical protein
MDVGTGQAQEDRSAVGSAKEAMERLLDRGFGGDKFMFALALGRNEEQLDGMLSGEDDIDEDLEMKVRGIAQERNIDIS